MAVEQTFTRGNRYALRVNQADVFTLRCTLEEADSTAVNLTAVTPKLIGRLSSFDTSETFSITGSIVGAATNGVVDFNFLTSETGDVRGYLAEIKLYGAASAVDTFLQFGLLIIPALVS